MNSCKIQFLFDSDAFITPFNQYYQIDFAPTFWDFLADNILADNILLLDKVYNEIARSKDNLGQWIVQFKKKMLKCNNIEVINYFLEVINYIKDSKNYNNKAFDIWSEEIHADGWLVATALLHGYTVVTLETPHGPFGKNPARNAKIPDIAKHFGVPCVDLFDVIKELGFKFF